MTMLLFAGHLVSYPAPECIRFNERCQVSHISVIPQGSKLANTEFVGATNNTELDIEVFLHVQSLAVKQLQPLKRCLLNYSPSQTDPTFAIAYSETYGPVGSRFLIIRSMKPYSTLSIAVYGTIIGLDTPRAQSFPFPQVPSVDDMLSGVAWKDVASSSIGGSGPYIPKMLLGRFDSEEERKSRLRYQDNKRREKQVRNAITAVKMMRQEGLISDAVASELDSKVDDDFAFMSQVAPILTAAMKVSN